MRLPEEFKIQAEKLDLECWPTIECSICGYQMEYLFEDGRVFYDSGCFCVRRENIQERSWQDVANRYNLQTHPDVIKSYDEFWGFDKQVKE